MTLTPIIEKNKNNTDYVTLDQLAKLLGTYPSNIKRWVSKGGLQPTGYLFPNMVWTKEAAEKAKRDYEDFLILRKIFPSRTKHAQLDGEDEE